MRLPWPYFFPTGNRTSFLDFYIDVFRKATEKRLPRLFVKYAPGVSGAASGGVSFVSSTLDYTLQDNFAAT
jgi:hypothetical protein